MRMDLGMLVAPFRPKPSITLMTSCNEGGRVCPCDIALKVSKAWGIGFGTEGEGDMVR